jgi:hypothetical protein
MIFRSKHPGHRLYKGMPFFPEWNPDEGGSYDAAEKWIIENIGRGLEGSSLHIIDPSIGFWPNSLEWTSSSKQNRQQIHKIVAQQRHTLREFEPLMTVRYLYQQTLKSSERKL